MRVLVLGGAGYLGHHIADQLDKQGHVVAVVARNTNRLEDPFYRRFRIVFQDLKDLETWLPDELKRSDAVIYAAGATFKMGGSSGAYYSVNVALVKRFLAVMANFPDRRTVYISSMSTLAGAQQPTLQHFPYHVESEDKKGVYDATKIQAERMVREYASQGRDIVIVNPGLMWGPRLDAQADFSSGSFILQFLQGRLPAYVEAGHSFSDVRDVAAGVVLAFMKGQKGRQYVLGGHNMTLSCLFYLLGQWTGQKIPLRLPRGILIPLSYILQMLSYTTLHRFKNPIPPDMAKSASLFYFSNSSLTIQELGYSIRPFTETAKDLMVVCQKRGWLKDGCKEREDIFGIPGPLALLEQCMRQHTRAIFLEKNKAEVEHIFLTNHALSDYLEKLHICSCYNRKKRKFAFPSLVKSDLRNINQFFEYLYFSSTDVLNSLYDASFRKRL